MVATEAAKAEATEVAAAEAAEAEVAEVVAVEATEVAEVVVVAIVVAMDRGRATIAVVVVVAEPGPKWSWSAAEKVVAQAWAKAMVVAYVAVYQAQMATHAPTPVVALCLSPVRQKAVQLSLVHP